MRGAVKRLVPKLLDSDATDRVVNILAAEEHKLLRQAKRLDDAVHATDAGVIEEVPDPEERAEVIRALLGALIQDSFEEFWIDTWLSDILETTDGVSDVLGDPDAWETRVEQVAAKYGVSLSQFESEVVEFERGEAARTVFAGGYQAVREVIEAAIDEVDE